MSNNITLTSSMRSNLASLKTIATQLDKTQLRLSSGKKVNSAIDNASNYYQARALTNRANDLNNLLDSIGQGIQTIEAATTGLKTLTNYLDQMVVTAEQTIVEAGKKPLEVDVIYDTNVQALLDAGYQAIDGSMTAAEINAILNQDDAKVVMVEDIDLSSSSFSFSGKNITFNGGGHKLTTRGIYSYGANSTFENMQMEITARTSTAYGRAIYSTQYNITVRDIEITYNDTYSITSAIEIRVSGTVENVDIKMSGDAKQMTGVNIWGNSSVNNVSVEIIGKEGSINTAIGSQSSQVTISNIGAKISGGTSYGVIGAVKGLDGEKIGESTSRPEALFDGKSNTEAILSELGEAASAASAADKFYVIDADEDWYLPSIGEWMEAYGTDMSAMTNGFGNSGAGTTTENKTAINNALKTLRLAGVDAKELTNGYYWSSSEYKDDTSWLFSAGSGPRYYYTKTASYYVRCFQLIENCFNPLTLSGAGGDGVAPKVGDIMYDDNSWSSSDAASYNQKATEGRTAVGVVVGVNDDGSVKIMNLKDLTFSSATAQGNFDPSNPYGGASQTTRWSTGSNMYKDIQGVDNYTEYDLLFAVNPNASVISVENLNNEFGVLEAESYEALYNQMIEQYDNQIEDSSYQGVNLLKSGQLELTTNETRTHKYKVEGKDVSSKGIGINSAKWKTYEDIATSINEIKEAIASLRSFAGELGNNYTAVQTRQSFIEALSDILETGSDKLLLADMNEESANYLALQTRQQLATNSLSLASQSAQSVLSLF